MLPRTINANCTTNGLVLPIFDHKDPCDRIIAAAARVSGATLVTADSMVLSSSHVRTLDARA
jgi:PIN domain nuclease of toxin-antitoxin system